MLIHDRRKELAWQIADLETNPRGDYTALGADLGSFEPDLNADGEIIGKRNWRVKERTRRGAQRFGITVRDSWTPFLGGTTAASVSVWTLNETFAAYIPDAPWIIPALAGGLVGWKAGEWGNKGTSKIIKLISRPIRAFHERYYFKI